MVAKCSPCKHLQVKQTLAPDSSGIFYKLLFYVRSVSILREENLELNNCTNTFLVVILVTKTQQLFTFLDSSLKEA